MEQLPPELVEDIQVKYLRYSVDVGGGLKLLSCNGFKYLVKSCPGMEALSEERQEELFLAAAGPGASKRTA